MERLIFWWSIRAHMGHPRGDLSHRPATFSAALYDEWRDRSLTAAIERDFNPSALRGKRVLDFGCGSGALTTYAARCGALSVTGTDLQAPRRDWDAPGCRFVLGTPEKVPVPDRSMDLILCFDVLEHLMRYREIIAEWRRVLAPGGAIWIFWIPWRHPYGHHMHTMIPLPWVHMIFSDAALLRICARIYDSPHFLPRHWHFDENNRRKPNPYGGCRLHDLNKLTIREFERCVAAAGLRITRKEIHPFTGRRLAMLKRLLVRSPWPDTFCSGVVYELSAPGTPPAR